MMACHRHVVEERGMRSMITHVNPTQTQTCKQLLAGKAACGVQNDGTAKEFAKHTSMITTSQHIHKATATAGCMWR